MRNMGLTYYKRYRMEIDLSSQPFQFSKSDSDYRFLTWHPNLLEAHAEAKYQSFFGEIDSNVFPCFTQREGCLRLMREITKKHGFLPQSTWLVQYVGAGEQKQEYCGTVQGIHDRRNDYGSIQNLGITLHHRGHGLAKRLMQNALAGFQLAGLKRAYLEVTAQNEPAVQLYCQLGFSRVRTLYKAVEVAYT